jgi:hypothetical protein
MRAKAYVVFVYQASPYSDAPRATSAPTPSLTTTGEMPLSAVTFAPNERNRMELPASLVAAV